MSKEEERKPETSSDSKLKKVRFVEEGREKSSTAKDPESRLSLIFDAIGRNGSMYRTITSNKPTITDKVINQKKGRGEKAVVDFYHQKQKSDDGKKRQKKKGTNYDYYFSDDITAKFIRLAEISEEAGSTLFEITVLLNDEANIELRNLDATPDAMSMIRRVYQWTYDSQLIQDAIVVIEECGSSRVDIAEEHEQLIDCGSNKKCPRLHIHVLTHLQENEVVRIKEQFLKKQKKRLQAKDYWDNEQLFTELHEIEEEDFGLVPEKQPDPDNEYWLNQFTRVKQGRKYLCIRLPISLDGADYITKLFGYSFSNDRHDTHIGLDGYPEVRRRLYEQSKGIDKRVMPERKSRKLR